MSEQLKHRHRPPATINKSTIDSFNTETLCFFFDLKDLAVATCVLRKKLVSLALLGTTRYKVVLIACNAALSTSG